MEPALVLDGVTKRFGDNVAVDHLNLEIPKGSIYGFIGPNGAGKTTTLRMVMSIFLPDEGRMSVLGQADPQSVKDRLGYLPEEKGLYPKMKAAEVLAYFATLKGMAPRKAKKRARELLTQHGLGERMDDKCESLSKGMGQKVQVLGTLIHEPELVILDEPFSGLDPVNQETLTEIILDMKRDGRTVIFSTHVMEQAEKLCDFIFLIDKGKKIIDGPLDEVRRAEGLAIRLEYADGDGAFLERLPGVTRVNDSGKHAEIFIAADHDPQDVLKAIVERLRVRRFDLTEPSLHEIFVRAVGGQSHE